MREQGYTTAYFGKWHLSMAGLSLTEGVGRERRRQLPRARTASTTPSSRPSLEPAGYNDGVYNDPLWTKQGVDWLRAARRPGQAVAVRRLAAEPARHRLLPARLRGRRHPPRLAGRAAAELRGRPGDQADGPQQYHEGAALIRGSIAHDDKATWKRLMNTYCDLIVNTDENLGAIVKALHDSGGMEDTVIIRTADHGEMARLAPRARQGPDDLRRAAADAAVDLLAEALPKQQGARTRALAEAVDIVPTCLELAGVADPARRYPVAARPLARPRGREPGDGTRQGLHGQHLRRGLVAPGLRGRRRRVEAPRARRAVGPLQGRALRRDDRQAADRDHRRPGVRALRPRRGPLRAAQPRARPGLQAAARRHARAAARAREGAPGPGRGAPLRHGRRWSSRCARTRSAGRRRRSSRQQSAPSPVAGLPGAYVQLPFGDPHLERRVYEAGGGERLPQTADESRAMAEARARQRAAMLCELGPGQGEERADDRRRPGAASWRALPAPRWPRPRPPGPTTRRRPASSQAKQKIVRRGRALAVDRAGRRLVVAHDRAPTIAIVDRARGARASSTSAASRSTSRSPRTAASPPSPPPPGTSPASSSWTCPPAACEARVDAGPAPCAVAFSADGRRVIVDRRRAGGHRHGVRLARAAPSSPRSRWASCRAGSRRCRGATPPGSRSPATTASRGSTSATAGSRGRCASRRAARPRRDLARRQAAARLPRRARRARQRDRAAQRAGQAPPHRPARRRRGLGRAAAGA